MNLSELHIKLKEKEISEDQYFLHGLYGSTEDNEKLSVTINQRESGVEYETYFREFGEKHSIKIFYTEHEACEFIYQKLIDDQTFNRIQEIEGTRWNDSQRTAFC